MTYTIARRMILLKPNSSYEQKSLDKRIRSDELTDIHTADSTRHSKSNEIPRFRLIQMHLLQNENRTTT